jgi:hypothetical protein
VQQKVALPRKLHEQAFEGFVHCFGGFESCDMS